MNKELNIAGDVRARYTSPRMRVVELHAQSCILSVSTDAVYIQSNDWDYGSESAAGLGDDEDE